MRSYLWYTRIYVVYINVCSACAIFKNKHKSKRRRGKYTQCTRPKQSAKTIKRLLIKILTESQWFPGRFLSQIFQLICYLLKHQTVRNKIFKNLHII